MLIAYVVELFKGLREGTDFYPGVVYWGKKSGDGVGNSLEEMKFLLLEY